jgi:hypothetical protein
MLRILLVSFSVFILVLCSQCSDEPESPNANFVIQKDTVIANIKQRIEVNKININDQVFLVSKSNAMFNSIWPGDSLKVGKNTVFQDYNMKQSNVGLVLNKTDSLMQIKTIKYQGIALPSGTLELAYKFNSKGVLTVTWVSSNCTSESCVSDILQKTITVE